MNLRDRFPHPYTLADAEAWVRFAPAQAPETNFAIEVGGEAVMLMSSCSDPTSDRRTSRRWTSNGAVVAPPNRRAAPTPGVAAAEVLVLPAGSAHPSRNR